MDFEYPYQDDDTDADREPPALTARERRALALVGEGGKVLCVHLVNLPIPAAGVERGDVLVHTFRRDSFPTMRGRVRYLSLDGYEALRTVTTANYVGAFTPLAGYDRMLRHGLDHGIRAAWPPYRQWMLEHLYRFLTDRRRWGTGMKVWHSRLAAVRPLPVERVSEPISAHSDDAALSELLSQVGGKMPGV